MGRPQAQGTGLRSVGWLQDTEEVRWLEPVPGQMMGKQREELEMGWPRCASSRNGGSCGATSRPLSFPFSPSHAYAGLDSVSMKTRDIPSQGDFHDLQTRKGPCPPTCPPGGASWARQVLLAARLLQGLGQLRRVCRRKQH